VTGAGLDEGSTSGDLEKKIPSTMRTRLALLTCVCTACGASQSRSVVPQASAARYLYVWAGDKDEKESDFLAVVDVRSSSPTYAQVIATEPVGMTGTMPHHMEYQLPGPGQLLFANGHHHEQIFLFNLEQPDHPRLIRSIGPPTPYRYPHDMVRLPDGNVLVGYLRSEGPSPAAGDTTMPGGHGGLAKLDHRGQVLRTVSAADSTVPAPIRPYSFAALPRIDRLVGTSAAMMEDTSADVVQLWRLSSLKLLRTIQVPPAHLADGSLLPHGHQLPFEPRIMSDGSVLLNAYGCGLYHLTDLDTPTPQLRNVYTFDVPPDELGACGIPVVVGHFWVMTVGRAHRLVTVDIRDPEHPVEVSRLVTDTIFHPHWLAKDPGSDRLILGAELGGDNRMLMVHIDSQTGRLSWDETFRSSRDSLGINFRRDEWPHGRTGEAFAHAALFRP
jgi:hypothetical protein